LPAAVLSAGNQNEPIHLAADYAAYRMEGDSTRDYIEIFYNLPRAELKFEPDTSGYVAIFDFSIEVADSTGAELDSATWKAGSRIDNLSVLKDSNYFISDMMTDIFPVGKYAIGMKIKSGEREGSCSFDMIVPVFRKDTLSLSSLQLAYEITPDTSSKFSKAGNRVLPNPSGRFTQDKNVVYIYAEGYDLSTAPGADSLYSIKIDILDKNGALFKSLPPNSYRKPGTSTTILTGFSTATFPRDSYSVRLSLDDGGGVAVAEKGFSVIATRERIQQEMLQSILNEFPEANRIASENDAKKFRDDIAFICTSDELKLYDSLNLEGKGNFQRDFWQARDPSPDTPENEFKLEHLRRVKYADDNFGQYQGFIRGWQTDRGRIYILYGEPSEIERNHSSIESRAWERWWYDSMEGGVYFIFVDLEDSGAYKLIHSSKKDEVKDYNWEDKVKMTLFQR